MPSYAFNQAPTIQLLFDWNNDGLYSHAYSDVTSYVMGFSSRQGADGEYQNMASKGTCNINLNNHSGLFSPLLNSSPLYGKIKPGVKFKLLFTHPSGNYTVATKTFDSLAQHYAFAGEIVDIEADATKNTGETVKLICQDYIGTMSDYGFKMPPLHRVPPHTVANIIFDTCFKGNVSTGFWWFKNNPTTSDHISLLFGAQNAYVWTFENTLSGAANKIKLGATKFETINNIVAALNNADGAGTLYSTNFQRPEFCTAATYSTFGVQRSFVDLTCTFRGYQGNSVKLGCLNNGNIYTSNSYEAEAARLSGTSHLAMLAEPSGTIAYDDADGGTNGTYSYSPNLNQTGVIYGLSATYFTGFSQTKFTWGGNTSWAFYMKPGVGSPDTIIMVEYDTISTAEPISIIWRGLSNYLEFNYKSAQISTSVNSLVDDTWYFIVCQLNGNTVEIYVNGTRAAYGSWTPVISGSNETYIGSNHLNQYVAQCTLSGWIIGSTNWDSTLATKFYNLTSNSYISENFTNGTFGLTNNNAVDFTFTSNSIFNYVGDSWNEDDTTCLQALEETAKSELGRVYQSRDGTVHYFNINDLLKIYNGYDRNNNAIIAYTANNTARFTLKSEKGRIFNSVNVKYVPRIASNGTVVLAQSNTTIRVPGQSGADRWNGTVVLPGGGSTVIKMDAINPDTGNKAGIESAISPLVPTTDFTANDAQDFSGYDYTNYVPQVLFFSLVINGSSVEVTARNTALGPLYVKNLQVRGKIIPMESELNKIVEDYTSITTYGKRAMSYDMKLDVASDFAQSVAEYLLSAFKDPLYRISEPLRFDKQLVVGSLLSPTTKHVLDVELYSIINVTDPTITNTLKFLVVGIEYDWQPKSLSVAIRIERVDNTSYLMLDNATFGLLDGYNLGV